MENANKQPKSTQKKLFLKIGFILVLILLLMIPNILIQNLIHERQGLESSTQRDIAASWGPSQRMTGPVLTIPFVTEVLHDDGVTKVENVLRVLPETLSIDVKVSTEERKKSIYKTILFNADHQLIGEFEMPKESDFGSNLSEIHWDQAKVDIGFTSSASLGEIVDIKFGNDKYKMESGASDANLFQSAIHADVVIDSEDERVSFSSNISINGSESINYIPLAGNTTVNMNSSWDSPGFVGLPLPKSRKITEAGFTAEWKTTEYNRPFKSMWMNNAVQLNRHDAEFGVDLVQTVGHYQKNMRSAKYALLIISLSFLVFFFFETLKGSKIHPVQYIFIGLTLSIFYALLLSLSEHIGFDKSYLIAAGGVVGLISWYSKFILRNGTNVMILSFILGGLYTYIYILLQMEEFALLVGCIGLFVTLGVTMYLSRNMNWYDLGNELSNSELVPDFEG